MQRVVISALRDQDYGVHTAREGFGGLASALADPPDLIISEIVMPGMSGWRLVRRLRENRQLARTPFMFLTRLACPESRRHSLRLGADDYMLKPCHPRELALRVAGLLRRARPVGASRWGAGHPPQERGRGLGGTIADISLASLLVLLEMERKTGLLVLSRVDGSRRCRMFLREGRIVGAYLDDDTTMRHAELLFHVLRWSSGAFEFKPLPVEMRDEVQISTTHLLIEASRRSDEEARGEWDCECEVLEDELH